eukprot:4706083-Prymnesium_polylepis.2
MAPTVAIVARPKVQAPDAAARSASAGGAAAAAAGKPEAPPGSRSYSAADGAGAVGAAAGAAASSGPGGSDAPGGRARGNGRHDGGRGGSCTRHCTRAASISCRDPSRRSLVPALRRRRPPRSHHRAGACGDRGD